MTDKQADPIKLAEWAEKFLRNVNDPRDFRWVHMRSSADCLRRLHARVVELEGQQKREPLSDEQISSIAAGPCWAEDGVDIYMFGRAIERAHGIQETK